MTLEVRTIEDGNQFFGAGSIVFLDDFDDVHGGLSHLLFMFGRMLSFRFQKKKKDSSL